MAVSSLLNKQGLRCVHGGGRLAIGGGGGGGYVGSGRGISQDDPLRSFSRIFVFYEKV